jgi:hypothetical protein
MGTTSYIGAGGATTMLKLIWAKAVVPAASASDNSKDRAMVLCFIGFFSRG